MTPKQVAFLFIEYALIYHHINGEINGWKKNISGCTMEAKKERGAYIWQSQWGVKSGVRVLNRCNQLLVDHGTPAQGNVSVISAGLQKETQ